MVYKCLCLLGRRTSSRTLYISPKLVQCWKKLKANVGLVFHSGARSIVIEQWFVYEYCLGMNTLLSTVCMLVLLDLPLTPMSCVWKSLMYCLHSCTVLHLFGHPLLRLVPLLWSTTYDRGSCRALGTLVGGTACHESLV